MKGGHDNYLDCSDYLGTPEANGFCKFTKDGDFYFSFVEHGRVILCSEGYSNEAGRDNGIESVIKNMSTEERYATVQTESGKWALALKAGNNKEIARSCEVNSEDEAKGFSISGRAAFAATLTSKSAAGDTSSKSGSTNADDDNYLVCREYEEKYSASAVDANGFVKFKHENTGQFYFAWFNAAGKIILRSEAYTTEKACVNGMESVLKNRDDKSKFSNIEFRGAHYMTLKAGNGQEIGRSCPQRDAASLDGILGLGALGAAAAGVGAMNLDTNINADANINANIDTKVDPKLNAKMAAGDVNVGGDASADANGCMSWLKWLLPLLLILGLLWFLWNKGCFSPKIEVPTIATDSIPTMTIHDSSAMATKAIWDSLLGEMVEVTLPDGTKIMVPANGNEKKLCDFLAGGCQGDLKSNWFDMDRIHFNTGSSDLHEVSDAQVSNLAAIFKAYSSAKFKIGGYTDNVGNLDANMKLSGDRAKSIITDIAGKGIDSARMRSEGYGPQHPVCPANDTEECKAKNRRCSIRVEDCGAKK